MLWIAFELSNPKMGLIMWLSLSITKLTAIKSNKVTKFSNTASQGEKRQLPRHPCIPLIGVVGFMHPTNQRVTREYVVASLPTRLSRSSRQGGVMEAEFRPRWSRSGHTSMIVFIFPKFSHDKKLQRNCIRLWKTPTRRLIKHKYPRAIRPNTFFFLF